MKAIYLSFLQMLRQMKQDVMLMVIVLVPFFAGAVFRFIVPVIEDLLTGYFGMGEILTPYYDLIDLFLIIITPSMFNYVVAMVILEEADDHMIAYLAVTPLGKKGYLFSRLGATGLISFPASLLMAALFSLTNMNKLTLIGIALAGTIQGVVVALLIVALSTNKVEGMAVGKMAALFSIGAVAPYFIAGKVQCIFAVLPSFWMAKAVQENASPALLISILLAVLWMVLLSGKFIRKAIT